MIGVYFNQHLGAVHYNCLSKYAFYIFYMKNIKKEEKEEKEEEMRQTVAKKNCFSGLHPNTG